MTTPRYQAGCAAGSQERGAASSPSDYAWNVNFNNGNVNNNNQNNTGFVRAVRRVPASECQGVALEEIYHAWGRARRNKKPSTNQMRFEECLGDGLIRIRDRLNTKTWAPLPTTLFIATNPKAREIHAPDFEDRVVHHLLVPRLEPIYEPRFIFDSYSNRKGKGTHAAVNRARGFMHQVHSGQGGGWYLQLDIHNFFNSIHRPTLYAMVKRQMVKADVPELIQRALHALLRRPVNQKNVIYRATVAERAAVPAHKRLENAAPGCGIPIGNLSSQFLANVYLDALDQFVKHTVKAKRYLRYVDDFVLFHESRAQLAAWQLEIEKFLRDQLCLELKPDIRLRPLTAGLDFLGFVIYPTHTRVRRRVISHAREKLTALAPHGALSPTAREQARAVWASYDGHFSHADSAGLRRDFYRRFPWLLEVAA